MGQNVEKKTVEMYMDGTLVATTIKDLTDKVKVFSQSLKQLAPDSEAFATQAKVLKETSNTLANLREEAGITGRAMKDLQNEAKQGADVWERLGETITGVFTGEALLEGLNKVKDAVFGFFEKSEEAATKLDQANVKQAVILKGLGDSSAMSKKELADLTEEIEKNTLFTKAQSKEAENILLTYDKIGHDVFPETIKAAANISSLFGGDLTRSTEALGRALENPIKGVNALRRAHVALSQESLTMITNLAKSGDTLGAQQAILGEIEKRYGGIAEAAAKADTALKTQFGKSVEALQEGLGMLLIKGLNPLILGFKNMTDGLNEWLFPAKQQSEVMEDNRIKANSLLIQINSLSGGDKHRLDLIHQLQDIYPDYLGNLDAEKVSNQQLTAEMSKVNDEMIKKIALQSQQEDITKKQKESADYLNKAAKGSDEMADALAKLQSLNGAFGVIGQKAGLSLEGKAKAAIDFFNEMKVKTFDEGTAINHLTEGLNSFIDNQQKSNDLEKESQSLIDKRAALMKQFGVADPSIPPPPTGQKNVNSPPDNSKERAQAAKDAEAQKEQRITDTQDLMDKIQDMEQKRLLIQEQQEIAAENRRYQKLLDDIGLSEATLDAKDKAFDAAEIDHQATLTSIQQKGLKQRADDELAQQQENTDTWYANEKARISQQFLDGKISQEEYNKQITALDKQLAAQRIATLKDYGKNASELVQQQLSAEVTARIDASKKITEAEKKESDERKKLIKEYAKDVDSVMGDINKIVTEGENQKLATDKASNDQQTQNLQNQLNSKVISQASYNAQVKAINDQYEKEERQVKHDQAIRDQLLAIFKTTITIAEGETEAIADDDIPKAIALGVTGAANLAAIAAQPIPALEEGGYISVTSPSGTYSAKPPSKLAGHVAGPSLALVGEKPEYVVNNDMLKNPLVANTVAMIENLRVGKSFQSGGFMSSASYTTPSHSSPSPSGDGMGEVSNRLLTQLISHISNQNASTRALHKTLKGGINARLGVEGAAQDQRRMYRSISNPDFPIVQ